MAPPPQAGKFKPRKPAKKINVGGSNNNEAVPVVVASSQAAAANNRPLGNRSGPGRGRGGGRGGRGGRGAPEQGQVFFTAAPKPESTRRGASASKASEATTGSSERGNDGDGSSLKRAAVSRPIETQSGGIAMQEEVVGVVEEGVGSSRISTTPARERMVHFNAASSNIMNSSPNAAGAAGTSGTKRDTKRNNPSAVDRYAYDSDSSNDEPVNIRKQSLQPISLPSLTINNLGNETGSGASLSDNPSPPLLFADESDKDAIRRENNGFFLFQLPTRLVPFQSDDKDGLAGGVENPAREQVIPLENTAAQVSVPSVHKDAFDNILSTANAGYLGKMVMYKSGRAEFILEGPNTDRRTSSDEGMVRGRLGISVIDKSYI